MDAVLKVRRYDPQDSNKGLRWTEYPLKGLPERYTVLDALLYVSANLDETLSLRYSCRSAVCGSCAMRINGHAGLACKTKLVAALAGRDKVVVEPLGNLPVLKDLVVHLDMHWGKVAAVQPYIQHNGEKPKREYLATNAAMLHLTELMNCIMCGSCVSDCPVLEVDQTYLGPAALAKAYRFVADPRDSARSERLRRLVQPGGMWDCARCQECAQVCPKGVAPVERIMALRARAMEAGLTNSRGARHAMSFTRIVAQSGRLDELRLPMQTVGITNVPGMAALAPVGLRSLLRGKLPPVIHKPIPEAQAVRRIVEKVGAAKG